MKRNKGNISGLMALLLLCVFAICVVLVLLNGYGGLQRLGWAGSGQL